MTVLLIENSTLYYFERFFRPNDPDYWVSWEGIHKLAENLCFGVKPIPDPWKIEQLARRVKGEARP
jgi:hypothetical protein